MPRTFRKIVLYGSLLAAGAALGMQLVNDNTSAGYGASTLPGSYSNASASGSTESPTPYSATTQVSPNLETGYEQGTYIKLPNGQTYYSEVQGNGTVNTATSSPNKGTQNYQTPGQLLLNPAPPTSVDRFANKTGELLQQSSQKGISWVVSLFSKLTS